MYLTNSIDIANQFTGDNGVILKICIDNNILDVTNFKNSKELIKPWFYDFINNIRVKNNKDIVTRKWTDDYLDSMDNQYDEEYVKYINEYAKINGFGGIKFSNDITVIWDNDLIKSIEKI